MQLDKLFTLEEQERIGKEMQKLYFEEHWSKERLRIKFGLSHDTLKEFARIYTLTKSPNQYNCKQIDRRFSKQELDKLAENIRVDYLDNLLTVSEIQAKYSLTWTEQKMIRERYNIVKSDEQVWETTQNSNEKLHGVRHMSHIEGHQEKTEATWVRKYGVRQPLLSEAIRRKTQNTLLSKFGVDNAQKNLEVQMKTAKTIYGSEFKSEENFYRVRKALHDENFLLELLLETPETERTYKQLSSLWQVSEGRIYTAVKEFGLGDYIYKTSYSTSYLEQDFEIALKSRLNGIEIHRNRRDLIFPQELDLYLPKYRLAVEINGTYWHNTDHVSRRYHQDKSMRCLHKDIQLVHLFEDKLRTDFDSCVSHVLTIISNMTESDCLLSPTYQVDFASDNGCWLKSKGYNLVSLSEPQLIHSSVDDNVLYDAGEALFSSIDRESHSKQL